MSAQPLPNAVSAVSAVSAVLLKRHLKALKLPTVLADRRRQAARFPNAKAPDDFDFAAPPALNGKLFVELLRGDCLERRESVILHGNPGAGKTHLATALAAAAPAVPANADAPASPRGAWSGPPKPERPLPRPLRPREQPR